MSAKGIRFYKRNPWLRHYYNAKTRCENIKYKNYKNYGGRGIKFLLTKEEIKTIWFRDKAWLLNKPSIDRVNNDEDYTYGNCRFIEIEENRIKDSIKGVNQYNLEGVFICNWKSARQIERILGIPNSNISSVCKGKRISAHGYTWRFI